MFKFNGDYDLTLFGKIVSTALIVGYFGTVSFLIGMIFANNLGW